MSDFYVASDHKYYIHGRVVYGEHQKVRFGASYLTTDLQKEEVEPLFEYARLHGAAQFEDEQERNYTLRYQRGRGAYVLERRS